MITRAVIPIKGQSDRASYELPGLQGRVRPPEDILRQARATSITGVLGQIASVASYAFEILQELKHETAGVQDRMAKLHERVDILAEVIECQLHESRGRKVEDVLQLLSSQEERLHSASPALTTSLDRPASVIKAYERCESIPPLELLDCFHDFELQNISANPLNNHVNGSSTNAGSNSRKKYSDPGFFMEEWLKNETLRQHQTLEFKEQRRRERRDGQNSRKKHDLTRQSTNSGVKKDQESFADSEQTLKFLSIRSWKEIYGTGEGKELRRQPQRGRSPNLRDLRKKAHPSFDAISHFSQRVEELPLPQHSLTPLDKTAHHLSVTDEQYATTPCESDAIPTILQGAFMLEMDDNEITVEMHLEDESNHDIPPPPPLPDLACPVEFTENGLSYYFDPATQSLRPPPPSLQENDEQSKCDSFFDTKDKQDEKDSPPPPPLEDFEQPPPPPPVEDIEQPPPPPLSEYPQIRLFEEIHLGTSLRQVNNRQSQSENVVPQSALLQQILQRQSRRLRPMESRARPPLQTRHATSAPFADSIARILERRIVIAYDSDSSHDDDDW